MGVFLCNPYQTHPVAAEDIFWQDLFVDWADSNFPDDWLLVGTHDTNNRVSNDSNGMKMISNNTYSTELKIQQAQSGLVTSTVYYYKIKAYSVTLGGFVFTLGDAATVNISNTTFVTGSFTQASTALKLKRDASVNAGVCDLVIEYVKISESPF